MYFRQRYRYKKVNIKGTVWLYSVFVQINVCFMVFSATFNNISAISWRSVLLVEEVDVTDKLYHIMLYTSPWSRFELTTSVVVGADFIGSCKFNYHTIPATTASNNDLLSIVATSSLFTLSVISVFLYNHEQTIMIYFHLSCSK